MKGLHTPAIKGYVPPPHKQGKPHKVLKKPLEIEVKIPPAPPYPKAWADVFKRDDERKQLDYLV